MNPPSDEYRVGFGRPPKETRWRKGQSGNPKRRCPARTYSTVELIDRLFASLVEVTVNGEKKTVSALEAILLQLWQKEVSGDRRALSTRLKYQEFAIQTSGKRIEMSFVDSEYTQAFAAEPLAARTNNG